MRWIINSATLQIQNQQGELDGDTGMLDAYMEANDNMITMPTFNAFLNYNKKNPDSVYWAAVMMLEELGEDWEEYGDIPKEPSYDSPPGVVH